MQDTQPADAGRGGPALPAAIFACALLGQALLATNPGYFSHDELQWAAFAAEGRAFDWSATDAFQYRPLTFTLWLWLSAHLFDTPVLFHSVLVAAGALNAAMAGVLARRLGATGRAAFAGAVVFALGAHATHVHGWIGTIGDVLWLGLALVAGLVASARPLPPLMAAAGVAALTALALLAKEAAVSIAPLAALAAWLGTAPGTADRRRWIAVAVSASVVVAAWLAWRVDALLGAPVQAGAAYALSIAHVPVRWLEQQLFLLDLRAPEVLVVLADGIGKRTVLAGLAWLAVVATLSRAGWRWAVAFLAGGALALAPALPLALGANQYGYAFACLSTLLAAAAWPRVPRWGRAALAFAAVLVLLHGMQVQRQVRMVGERQAVFSPAVARALAGRDAVLRLHVADGDDAWIYQRLTHEVPHYGGEPFGDRVRIVPDGEPADMHVRPDGTLEPVAVD